MRPSGLSADPKAESDDEIVLEPQRHREVTFGAQLFL